jgi:pyruvate/2-oxoglutarate dehydrogenase complex dihydrolipoamide dehydrogenase (E3) component
MGEGYFVSQKTLEVRLQSGEVRQLSAEKIFINVGARPTMPPIEGVESVPVLNSTTIMELDTVPEHLVVLGGGYVGLEFAQMFRRFGSQVTVVQRGAQLLPREDADIAENLTELLREDGVGVLLKTAALRVAPAAGGVELTVRTPEGERTLMGSHLLAATGRTPNSDSLHLAATGVAIDKKGFIQVNDRLETNVPGIYALGDVKGGPEFTHISYDDFRIIRTNLLEHGEASIKGRLLLYTVFTDPQLGRVGLTETEARQQGRKIKVAKMPMNYVARALEVDESRGIMKAIVDAETEQILGAAVLGIEGGEMMAMFEIAMLGQLPYPVLRDGVFAHPTLAESLNNLFASL